MNDLRFALRQLVRNPGYTAVVVATLTLGIGANTAIFSLVNGVLLKPLPYHRPDRLFGIAETVPTRGIRDVPVAFANYVDWRTESRAFAGMAAYTFAEYNLTGRGEPQRLVAARATANLFSVVGVAPLVGRGFTPDEEKHGSHFVTVLGERFWRREFGGDPSVLGRNVTLDGDSYTVVGVMPDHFRLPDPSTALWVPAGLAADDLADRGSHSWQVVGRLADGVEVTAAQAELDGIQRRLGEQFEDAREFGVALVALQERLVGETRRPLLILLGAVGFVLLIACANVANLALARAADRQREFAVRAALGAARATVFRQLMVENAVLALTGGVLGSLVAWWGVSGFAALASDTFPRTEELSPNTLVLAFSLTLSLGAGLLFGLVPALEAWRSDVNAVLKDQTRGSTEGRRRQRLRSALIVGEVALSLILLAGAGLLMRSFTRVRGVDPGFRPEGLLVANISLPEKKYPGEQVQVATFLRMIEGLQATPGVESAAGIFGLPFGRMVARTRFQVEGRPPPGPSDPDHALYRQVTPGLFRTLGTPFLAGRDFDARDVTNAARVAIVNQSFMRTFFPGSDPRVLPPWRINLDGGTNTWTRIVGIVADTHDRDLAGKREAQMYFPVTQRCWGFLSLVARTTGDPEALAPAFRRVVHAVDPEQPLEELRSMTSIMDRTLEQRRWQAALLGAFSVLALLLAAVGIYGVMACSVARRTQEIGIRMALGAQWSDVRRFVLRRGMGMTTAGLGLGLVGGFALARLLAGLLYDIQPHDPPTFGSVTLLLAGVALAACWIPARRASRIDPMVALRSE